MDAMSNTKKKRRWILEAFITKNMQYSQVFFYEQADFIIKCCVVNIQLYLMPFVR
jgi:hypothetical protein